MSYPVSDDIICIHTCVISLLTNHLTVFSCVVKHLWFPIWCFQSLRWSFRLLKLSFKFFSKMETSRFVQITDKELIKFIEKKKGKSEYIEEDCVQRQVIQKNLLFFIQTNKLGVTLVQNLFMSFHLNQVNKSTTF